MRNHFKIYNCCNSCVLIHDNVGTSTNDRSLNNKAQDCMKDYHTLEVCVLGGSLWGVMMMVLDHHLMWGRTH